jgi:hypothetical protein
VRLPEPEAGLIISYSYLWFREHEQGQEEGAKDRPCAIVVAITRRESDEGSSTDVLVVPITHTPPKDESEGMEIPAAVKKRLGLDFERSWVVLSESNTFTWPGPDLRSVSGGGTVAYGFLPPNFFNELRRRFVALERARRIKRVPRTE